MCSSVGRNNAEGLAVYLSSQEKINWRLFSSVRWTWCCIPAVRLLCNGRETCFKCASVTLIFVKVHKCIETALCYYVTIILHFGIYATCPWLLDRYVQDASVSYGKDKGRGRSGYCTLTFCLSCSVQMV